MKFPIPPPTILFINPDHLKSLTSSILGVAKKSWLLFSVAWRHKIAGLTEGFVTKDSLWDRLLFDTARARVVDECAGSLRGIVVAEGKIPLPPDIIKRADEGNYNRSFRCFRVAFCPHRAVHPNRQRIRTPSCHCPSPCFPPTRYPRVPRHRRQVSACRTPQH